MSRRKESEEPRSYAGLITAEKLSALTGYTDVWHRQLAKKHYFDPPVKGLYQTVPAIRGVIRYLQEQIEKSSAPFISARQKKIEAQSTLLQIQVAKARGEVVDAADVSKEWKDMVLTIRSKLLSLPNRLGPRLALCRSGQELAAEVDKGVREVLVELSRRDGSQVR